MAATFSAALIGSLLTGVFILLGAYIAYKGGLQTYFKKREHEQIIKRYLEEGLDRASACFDHATGVFTDNYRTALHIVREIKVDEKVNLSSVNFRTSEQRYFDVTPWFKISHLVGDIIFWRLFQLFFAFVDAKTLWFDVDFRSTVAQVLNGKITLPKEKLLDEIKNKLDEFYEESNKYTCILHELQIMASILEKETTITWSALSKFKNRPEIKESVEKLKQIFDELKEKDSKDKQKQ